MRPPLWLSVSRAGAELTVSLAKCQNCGEVKVTSSPCGFDHVAALMEFGDYLRDHGIDIDGASA